MRLRPTVRCLPGGEKWAAGTGGTGAPVIVEATADTGNRGP